MGCGEVFFASSSTVKHQGLVEFLGPREYFSREPSLIIVELLGAVTLSWGAVGRCLSNSI